MAGPNIITGQNQWRDEVRAPGTKERLNQETFGRFVGDLADRTQYLKARADAGGGVAGDVPARFKLSATSAALAQGDLFCVAPEDFSNGLPVVTKATTAAVTLAGTVAGMLTQSAGVSPGAEFVGSVGGIVRRTVTGLATSNAGMVRVSSTGRCQRIAGSGAPGDHIVGMVDGAGNLTMVGFTVISEGATFPSGNTDEVLMKNGGSEIFAKIANAQIAVGAGIGLPKLDASGGTDGQVVRRVAGALALSNENVGLSTLHEVDDTSFVISAGQKAKVGGSLRIFRDLTTGDVSLCPKYEIGLADPPYDVVASITTATVNTTSGSPNITTTNPQDFKRRHEVAIVGAGTSTPMTTPPAPVLSLATWALPGKPADGVTTGTLSIWYKIVPVSEDRGYGIASPAGVITNAPNYLSVSIGSNANWLSAQGFYDTNVPDLANCTKFVDGRWIGGLWSGALPNEVWLNGQTDPNKNGFYSGVLNGGATGLTMSLTRAVQADSVGEYSLGRRIHVLRGSNNAGKFYRISQPPTTLETTPIVAVPETFVQIQPLHKRVHYRSVANIPNITSAPWSQDLLDRDGRTVTTTTLSGTAGTIQTLIVATHQTNNAENGVYAILTASGGMLTAARATGFDTAGAYVQGTYILTQFGVYSDPNGRETSNEHGYLVQNSATPGTLGTDPITYRREKTRWFLVYRSFDNVTYSYIGAMLAQGTWQGGADIPFIGHRDFGYGTIGPPTSMPTTPPATARNDVLFAKILTSATVGGTTTLTLDVNAGATVTGATMHHDSSDAIRRAIQTGGEIIPPVGTINHWRNMDIDNCVYLRGRMARTTTLRMMCGAGVTVHGIHTSVTGGQGDHTTIADLEFSGDPVTEPSLPEGRFGYIDPLNHRSGALIQAHTRFNMRRGRIANCRGSALVISGRDWEHSNANGCTIEDVYITGTRFGHGVHNVGSDSNTSRMVGLWIVNCMGHAFFLTTQLDTTLMQTHASGNHWGSPYYSDEINAVNMFGAYSEGGPQVENRIKRARVFGGWDGNPWDYDTDPAFLFMSQGDHVRPFIIRSGIPGNANQTSMALGDRSGNLVFKFTNTVLGGLAEFIQWSFAGGHLTSSGQPDTTTGRMFAMQHLGGKAANMMAFARGFLVGPETSEKRWLGTNADGSLPMGHYAPGDHIEVNATGDLLVPTRVFGVGTGWTASTKYNPGHIIVPAVDTPNKMAFRNEPTGVFTGNLTQTEFTSAASAPNFNSEGTLTDGDCRWVPMGANSALSTAASGAYEVQYMSGKRTVSLTALTAGVASANFYSAAPAQGLYEGDIYVACTTSDVTSDKTVQVTIGFTDDAGATTITLDAPLATNAVGRARKSFTLWTTGATHITYQTTVTGSTGTIQYSLRIVLRRKQ